MHGEELYKTTIQLKKSTGKILRISAYELECCIGEIIDALTEEYLGEYKKRKYEESKKTLSRDILPDGARSDD